MKILSFDVGIVNLAYCILDNTAIQHWEIIDIGVSTNTCITLIRELDKREYLCDVDTVLIEKQPSFNPKMRVIAGCLQSYFYIRGMVDRERIKSVEFFSPKNKLKCYHGPPLTIESKAKSKYAQTKKMGILIAESKLQEYTESDVFKRLFQSTTKKDDLSDCYLQALSYLERKHFVSPMKHENVLYSKAHCKRDLMESLEKGTPFPESLVGYLEKEMGVQTFTKESLLPVLTSFRMKKYLSLVKT
jgi:hypothetical protein